MKTLQELTKSLGATNNDFTKWMESVGYRLDQLDDAINETLKIVTALRNQLNEHTKTDCKKEVPTDCKKEVPNVQSTTSGGFREAYKMWAHHCTCRCKYCLDFMVSAQVHFK